MPQASLQTFWLHISSNKKVVAVNSKGVVKGIKKGKATITVKCNGITKKFVVTVK